MRASGLRKMGLLGLCALAGQGMFGAGAGAADARKAAKSDAVAEGREIFNREWLADDPRGHGGDGLGPVYNDSSCVACHNSGGVGGAGPVSKNIDILSATRNGGNGLGFGGSGMVGGMGNFAVQQPFNGPASGGQAMPKRPPANLEPLLGLHAGFKDSRTVVLHRFGTDPNYENWRRAVSQGQFPQPQQQMGGVNNFETFGNTVQTVQVFDGPEPPALATTAPVDAVAPVSGAAPAPVASGIEELRGQGNVSGAQFARMNLVRQQHIFLNPNGMPQVQGQAMTADMKAEMLKQQARASMQAAGSMQMQVGEFTVSRSQRNPTPLFGLGLIDAIPEKAIEEAAARRYPEFPEVQGRVSRLKDGKVGRLGWKGQTANSEDFVLTACAVELGLEVPGHNQGIVPQAPKYKADGMDLNADECDKLVAYVRSLPKPEEREAADEGEAKVLASGKAMFASVGCASCHTQKLGEVDGIFSDLLLHDMGPEMADLGSYNGGGSDDDSEPLGPLADAGQPGAAGAPAAAVVPKGATRQEWRTPPLWGFRDSAPYLHDGRAQTLEQAIALHGGQASGSANRYFKLSARERAQVEAFLKSLVAPSQLALAGE